MDCLLASALPWDEVCVREQGVGGFKNSEEGDGAGAIWELGVSGTV